LSANKFILKAQFFVLIFAQEVSNLEDLSRRKTALGELEPFDDLSEVKAECTSCLVKEI
jgi:hypothetical protein